jgi:hypothetical protein
MDLSPTKIWQTWNSGGPFVGDRKPNARVLVEPNWFLEYHSSSQHRGRGTWWRDDPSTLSEFAMRTSWVMDSRLRNGARSFQRIRNGSWTWWGSGNGGTPTVTPPSTPILRKDLAVYLKTQADTLRAGDPTSVQALPSWDGTPDYADIGHLSYAYQNAIGQLTQAGVFEGYVDGTFRPDQDATDLQITLTLERLENYLGGAHGGGASMELPNVLSVGWDRSVDTDTAQCTITMLNQRMPGNAEQRADDSEFGYPGYFTPARGKRAEERSRWPNHVVNEWSNVLMPNVIVRTFEGYGGEHLSIRDAVAQGYIRQTGTWLIDKVTISTSGEVTIQARDMGRLLLEQFMHPPIVPEAVYPLRYYRYVTLKPGEDDNPGGEERSGNYADYGDIIYDLLIWAGFYWDTFPREPLMQLGAGPAPDAGAEGFAQVHGVIETTGAWATETLPEDLFDKRPVMDGITEIRNIVGYLFWIDEMGAAHFRSPNWFEPGNFTEELIRVDLVPVIDEKVQLTNYSMTLSSENVRTQIIIASDALPPVPPYGSTQETYDAYKDALGRATFYEPTQGRDMWHGMHLPSMWVNGAFNDPVQQEDMAQLIAMHIHFRHRQGSLTIVGNPCIQVDDQVKIFERQTADTYLHYVRGISSSLNNVSGEYEMRLTTHWLGDGDGDEWLGEGYHGSRIATLNPGAD